MRHQNESAEVRIYQRSYDGSHQPTHHRSTQSRYLPATHGHAVDGTFRLPHRESQATDSPWLASNTRSVKKPLRKEEATKEGLRRKAHDTAKHIVNTTTAAATKATQKLTTGVKELPDRTAWAAERTAEALVGWVDASLEAAGELFEWAKMLPENSVQTYEKAKLTSAATMGGLCKVFAGRCEAFRTGFHARLEQLCRNLARDSVINMGVHQSV